jgi:hypothetical protein
MLKSCALVEVAEAVAYLAMVAVVALVDLCIALLLFFPQER